MLHIVKFLISYEWDIGNDFDILEQILTIMDEEWNILVKNHISSTCLASASSPLA